MTGRYAMLALLGAGLALAPLAWPISGYALAFFVNLFMYVALAQSWNLFSGFTGHMSFGHGVFFGVGAYTFAIWVGVLGRPLIEGFLVAGVVTVLSALLIGSLLLSAATSVAFFAVITLGINEIVRGVVVNARWAGGSSGINLPAASQTKVYYALLAVVVAGVLATELVRRSWGGLALRALLSDEVAAEVSGVPTRRYKFWTFVVSAVFPGVAGAAVGWNWSYVDPSMAFDLNISFLMLEMALLGGVGTSVGPVLGAVFITVITEVLAIKLPYLHAIIFGVVLIGVLFVCPGGLVELGTRAARRLGGRRPAPAWAGSERTGGGAP